jgi:hypothetical protein
VIVLPRGDYEDLVDALAARKVEAALAAGRDELLTSADAVARLAAPTPLAFGATSAAASPTGRRHIRGRQMVQRRRREKPLKAERDPESRTRLHPCGCYDRSLQGRE